MELLTHRHRDLTVFVLVLVAQLLLLGYQVRGPQDTRLVRLWAVTAVTPAAKLLESARRGVSTLLHDYVLLVDVHEENLRLQAELNRLKLEAQFLRSELATADRAVALAAFRSRSPSQTVAAHIIGASTVADSRVVYIDRGTNSGVLPGMAVITPDGIVGRIHAVYPSSSQATLITDPGFAAGVMSQKNRVQGTLKGRGDQLCFVDHVQYEETVEVGEWFYTTGDDRVFPRGLPVGQVVSVSEVDDSREILVAPAGLVGGLEEVLIVIEASHQPIPQAIEEPQPSPVALAPPTRTDIAGAGDAAPVSPDYSTDADRLMDQYRRIGEAQGHEFGAGLPGSAPPNFNLDPDAPPARATPGTAEPPPPLGGAGPAP